MSRSVPISISAFPASRQEAIWRETLVLLSLANPQPASGVFQFGDISIKDSPSGARLALLRSSSQDFVPLARPEGALNIGFIQYGRGHVTDGGRRACEFADGDIWVGDPLENWRMHLRNDFEMLLLQVPRERILNRIGRNPHAPTTVLGESGSAAAARPAMRAFCSNFALLEDRDVMAGEAAITELVLAALLAETRHDEDSVSQVQAAHFSRVCAQIELRLGEPELAIGDIARSEGLSPRYIQKLFEAQDRAFSDYVRHRRLEHCRKDLLNPQYCDCSVAEIGFRWGFGNAAHFSRAFSSAYGISPRDLRKTSGETVETRWTRGRPLHGTGRPARSQSPAPVVTGGGDAEPARPEPEGRAPLAPGHHHLAVSRDTVHWGYLSRSIPPVLRVRSGDQVTVETLTQHAYDDYERMIRGDEGAQSVFRWTASYKAVNRRGAGPVNASIFGRGAGEGFGVHICTGPIFVHGAEPGDVLEIEILDLKPRPSANPEHRGFAFGSNAAAAWGYHHDDMLSEPKKREVVTIYRTDADGESGFAEAVYSFVWQPQTDPFGVLHEHIDYPGIPVDHGKLEERPGIMAGVRIPVRPHFGFVAVAPREAELVDSVPPGYFGGNIDNWRAGKGSSIYLPVAVPGALLSIGDPHLAQGDGEISGTALECSLTGNVRLVLHKRNETEKTYLNGLGAPLIETPTDWLLHGFSYTNYLRELGRNAQSEVFKRSSLNRALKSAFRAARKFLMERYGLDEDEAISLISVGVDFGVTQVADGNWGIHAKISKAIFEGRDAG
ncbi:acetamidase/formamidase family protein [Rhizobium halophytocola]|uniref:Acetamidase/formamidase/AraC-like DNA-binding protein n=1 Tax=Rhizobium halophytocola TaxID=735519 RepID=A0ABS4DUK8_9HYPH|nr:acetamidase/formamidase family protein [Rhizobium halophytocola]MBP1849390.1 acetamidase/formamidase/AraC-like DNA-binding protein [Rhizobium halophytocola]